MSEESPNSGLRTLEAVRKMSTDDAEEKRQMESLVNGVPYDPNAQQAAKDVVAAGDTILSRKGNSPDHLYESTQAKPLEKRSIGQLAHDLGDAELAGDETKRRNLQEVIDDKTIEMIDKGGTDKHPEGMTDEGGGALIDRIRGVTDKHKINVLHGEALEIDAERTKAKAGEEPKPSEENEEYVGKHRMKTPETEVEADEGYIGKHRKPEAKDDAKSIEARHAEEKAELDAKQAELDAIRTELDARHAAEKLGEPPEVVAAMEEMLKVPSIAEVMKDPDALDKLDALVEASVEAELRKREQELAAEKEKWYSKKIGKIAIGAGAILGASLVAWLATRGINIKNVNQNIVEGVNQLKIPHLFRKIGALHEHIARLKGRR